MAVFRSGILANQIPQNRYTQEIKDLSQELTTKISEVTTARIEQITKEFQDQKRARDESIEHMMRQGIWQLRTAELESKTTLEAFEVIKNELDRLKAENKDSAARFEQWRESMLRVANEAPFSSVLATQPEVIELGEDA